MSSSSSRRLRAATVAAAALVVGLLTTPAPATALTVSVTTYSGKTADGSAVRARVPSGWNGTLLLYSHGYRQAGDPAAAPASRVAADASSEAVAQDLLARGYAIAGSSYSRNGFATAEGVRADELLYSWFRGRAGAPTSLYVWGESLGGLITELFAEKHPELVDGVLQLGAVVGGTVRNFDLALDYEVMVKRLVDPTLKLTGYSSYAEALAAFNHAYAAITAALASSDSSVKTRMVSRLLAIQLLLDGPDKSLHYDGSSLTSSVGAAVETVATGLFYSTVDRYEIERRVGGNPSTNMGVDYRHRISAADLTRYASFGFGTGLLTSYATAVQSSAARVAANPTARARLAALGTPTGRITVPTVNMHTAADPLVVVQNQRVFVSAVAAAGRSALLQRLVTVPPASYSGAAPYGAGHVNFTRSEVVGALTGLIQWASSGVKPAPASWSTALGQEVSAGYPVAAWPAR